MGAVVCLTIILIALGLALEPTGSEKNAPSHSSTTSIPPDVATTDPSTTAIAEQPTDTLVPGASAGWRLERGPSTDFPGDTLNSDQWHVYDSVGNQGVGYRRPSAVTQSNSEMTITAKDDVSGGVAQTHSQLYGRWVVRAKMDKGAGYGPAILLWPDSEKWPDDGEIDFAEMPDGGRTQAVMTAHYGPDNRQLSQTHFDDYSQWHTFGVDWLPDKIVFYIDGAERYRITDKSAIPSTPMHLAIQNDIGACDSWIGCRNSSTPPEVALHIGGVRVYQSTTTN